MYKIIDKYVGEIVESDSENIILEELQMRIENYYKEEFINKRIFKVVIEKGLFIIESEFVGA